MILSAVDPVTAILEVPEVHGVTAMKIVIALGKGFGRHYVLIPLPRHAVGADTELVVRPRRVPSLTEMRQSFL